MDIVGMSGFRTMARVAVVTAAMTALSGVAWAQYSSGPSGAGPHVGPSSGTMTPQSAPSPGAGEKAAECTPNSTACGGPSGGSGAASSKGVGEGGQSVNDLEVKSRNDKIPSRRTDD